MEKSKLSVKEKMQILLANFLVGMVTTSSYKVKNIFKLFLISFVILFLFNISSTQNTQPVSDIKYVNFGDTKIKVELAISDAERAQGLSGNLSLSEGEGMLFVFDKPNLYKIWMKDMNFPIDIIWFSENKKIVYIQENAKPEDFPALYGPKENAKYVLEVSAGFSEKNKLKVGDKVDFTY
jgi:uncharacterized membrane protein (UPF0127 family)